MRTSKEYTFTALDTFFYNSAEHKVNFDHINESMQLLIDNTPMLYNKVHTNRRAKETSILWHAFTMLANECLEYTFYPEKFQATSAHMKAYLAREGEDYGALVDTLDYIKQLRGEHLKK